MVTIVKFTCKVCGHIWIPRKPDPKVCPHCKSFEWREGRR